MNMSMSLASLLALSMVLVSGAFATEGSSRGGGDNPPPYEGSAWFPGTGTIQYCYELDPNFGMTAQQVESNIEASFQSWVNYIEKKHVNSGRDESESLLLKRALKRVCDGTEDLKFYFGVNTAVIEQAKARYYNPIAFAYLSQYSLAQGWGKGFIWVAPPKSVFPKTNFPDWSNLNLLPPVLLHEMGHILGNGHMDGTIMSEGFTTLLQNPETQFGKSIDGWKELYVCHSCPVTGIISKDAAESEKTFTRFVGRPPMGKATGRFEFETLTLTLTDSIGSTSLPILMEKDYSTVELESTVFQVMAKLGSDVAISESSLVNAGTYFGRITAKDGASYILTVDLNMGTVKQTSSMFIHPNQSALQIKYFVDGHRVALFEKVIEN